MYIYISKHILYSKYIVNIHEIYYIYISIYVYRPMKYIIHGLSRGTVMDFRETWINGL